MDLFEYASAINNQITVKYLYSTNTFMAQLDKSEIKDRGCLISPACVGETIELALMKLTKALSEKTIVFGAYTPNRIEYDVPKLEWKTGRVA